MQFERSTWIRVCVSLMLFLILFAIPGFAQNDDEDASPWYEVPALDPAKPWLQWLLVVGFGAFCVLIAMKNPHRSHLD